MCSVFRTPLSITVNNLTPNTNRVLTWEFISTIQAAPPSGMFDQPSNCASGNVCQSDTCAFIRGQDPADVALLF